MERILNKAKNFKEAERWDILQQISMTEDERQRVSMELKKRFYSTVSSRRSDRVKRGRTESRGAHQRRKRK